ncbi:MAG: type II toxin-antitoxin system VapC family toxin, partial [Fervidicoccaceae archaeon]
KELIEKIFTVVYPDQRITLKAMELDVQLRKQGFSIPQADVLIAATALTLDAPLLSRDLGHYEKLRSFGLKILTEL